MQMPKTINLVSKNPVLITFLTEGREPPLKEVINLVLRPRKITFHTEAFWLITFFTAHFFSRSAELFRGSIFFLESRKMITFIAARIFLITFFVALFPLQSQWKMGREKGDHELINSHLILNN